MNLTPKTPAREAAATGFGVEPLEKVFRLMALLDALNSHPFLKPRIALKGGTALNLFHFEVPRLSVDIDLNYIGSAAREAMLGERPKVEQAVQAVCSREGLAIKRMPPDHAGGKWRLTYVASKGGSGSLELDLRLDPLRAGSHTGTLGEPGQSDPGIHHEVPGFYLILPLCPPRGTFIGAT
ncbi:MAG: nucleotidyl transferase AbiEii/AbiGii toxin family protein [Syntrophales bacterium]